MILTILGILAALQCSWAWAYRGGSTHFNLPSNRFTRLLATPLFMFLAIWLAVPFNPILNPLDAATNHLFTFLDPVWMWLYDHPWMFLILSGLAFILAQTNGWGRQMDLGDNDKPDNERWYWIRDFFFVKKSSFSRDLAGLFMRFIDFALVGALALNHSWQAAFVSVSLLFVAPLLWVAEHLWIKGKVEMSLPWAPGKPIAWVEWSIGIYIALATVTVILV